MGRQLLWKIGQDQRFRMVLDGWPGKPGIQGTFWKKPALRILVLQECFPPSGGT